MDEVRSLFMSLSVVVGWVGVLDAFEGDEGQAEVAHALKQSVEGGLVGDRSADDGGPVAVAADGHPVEPGGPVRVKVAREPDLVVPGLGASECRCRSFGHSAPCACCQLELR